MDFWSFQKKIPTLAPYIKRYLNRMPRFELNILGCGSATSTLRHLPTSQVLNVRDNVMMIDCGEGAQLEMRRRICMATTVSVCPDYYLLWRYFRSRAA